MPAFAVERGRTPRRPNDHISCQHLQRLSEHRIATLSRKAHTHQVPCANVWLGVHANTQGKTQAVGMEGAHLALADSQSSLVHHATPPVSRPQLILLPPHFSCFLPAIPSFPSPWLCAMAFCAIPARRHAPARPLFSRTRKKGRHSHRPLLSCPSTVSYRRCAIRSSRFSPVPH